MFSVCSHWVLAISLERNSLWHLHFQVWIIKERYAQSWLLTGPVYHAMRSRTKSYSLIKIIALAHGSEGVANVHSEGARNGCDVNPVTLQCSGLKTTDVILVYECQAAVVRMLADADLFALRRRVLDHSHQGLVSSKVFCKVVLIEL